MNSEIKVVVLCTNSKGQPEFYTCLLEVTSKEVSEGKHLELAKEDAALNGYGGPMIAFDNTSPAGLQLGEITTARKQVTVLAIVIAALAFLLAPHLGRIA